MDRDGVEITVLSGHFHHNTEKRRKQWNLVNLRKTSPLLIGADCNSLLNALLDSGEKTSESEWILRARSEEVQHYRQLGVQDLLNTLYRGHDSEGHGGANPRGYTRGKRRIDRWMVTPEVAEVADGAYTIPVAHSDHLGLVLQLGPPRISQKSRWTFDPLLLEDPDPDFCEALDRKLKGVKGEGANWWSSAIATVAEQSTA